MRVPKVKVLTVEVMLDASHGTAGSYDVTAYDGRGVALSRMCGIPVQWVSAAAQQVADAALQAGLKYMHRTAERLKGTEAVVLSTDIQSLFLVAGGLPPLQEVTGAVVDIPVSQLDGAGGKASRRPCAGCDCQNPVDDCDDCPDRPDDLDLSHTPAGGIGGVGDGEFRK